MAQWEHPTPRCTHPPKDPGAQRMLFSRRRALHLGGVGWGAALSGSSHRPPSPDLRWGGIWSDGKVFKGQRWIFSKCYYL